VAEARCQKVATPNLNLLESDPCDSYFFRLSSSQLGAINSGARRGHSEWASEKSHYNQGFETLCATAAELIEDPSNASKRGQMHGQSNSSITERPTAVNRIVGETSPLRFDLNKGEQTAHACGNAWFRQLSPSEIIVPCKIEPSRFTTPRWA
jgi:hypothetical protein